MHRFFSPKPTQHPTVKGTPILDKEQLHTSATNESFYSIPAAATPTPTITPKIGAILSPGAAAELDITADAAMVEDDFMELDIMPELIEVSIAPVAIFVDDDIMSLDIIVSDIIVSDIIVSDIMESDIIVSVMSVGSDIIDIVIVEAVVVDWAATRALRVQMITVMKCMFGFNLKECFLVKSELG